MEREGDRSGEAATIVAQKDSSRSGEERLLSLVAWLAWT